MLLTIADNVLYEKSLNGLNACSSMGKPLARIHELVGVTMKYEVSSGLTLAASVYGSPSDNLVILLHGGGQTRHAWELQVRNYPECGFYAVALDLRGHGDSDWSPDGSYKVENFRDDLLSVIRQIESRCTGRCLVRRNDFT